MGTQKAKQIIHHRDHAKLHFLAKKWLTCSTTATKSGLGTEAWALLVFGLRERIKVNGHEDTLRGYDTNTAREDQESSRLPEKLKIIPCGKALMLYSNSVNLKNKGPYPSKY